MNLNYCSCMVLTYNEVMIRHHDMLWLALMCAKKTMTIIERLLHHDNNNKSMESDDDMSSPIRTRQLQPVDSSMMSGIMSEDMYVAIKKKLLAVESDKDILQNKHKQLIEAIMLERDVYKQTLDAKDKKYKDRATKYDEEIEAHKSRYNRLRTKYDQLKKVMMSSGIMVSIGKESGYASDI